MANWRSARFNAAILLISCAILFYGCAGGQTSQQVVSPLYMLTEAGFQRWDVNMETPKSQALLNALPYGKIVTYKRDGEVYHVYGDKNSNALYVGNAAAYQKYLSMTQAKQICERVEGKNQQEFWTCFEEFQTVGPRPQGK